MVRYVPQSRVSFSFAFSAPVRLFSPSQSSSACVCMKAKRNGAASEKRSSKNKRSSPPGAGFGSENSIKRPPSKEKSVISAEEEDENSRRDLQLEKSSGAQGDATPHRALVNVPTSKDLENPQDESLEDPLPPLIELPEVSRERITELRFDRREGLDTLIERFADSRTNGNLGAVIVANRDMVTERLLYRFTSAILQVETRTTDVESREEEASNMRSLRKDIIAYCWSYDFPLKVELQAAEARLLIVLQGENVKSDVARNCGKTTLQVDSFWIVIFAAVAAWEERGRENPKLANVNMQKVLAAAADACNNTDDVKDRLSPALKAVQKILTSSDPRIQMEVVDQVDEDTIASIGAFTEQIRLFPSGAYGALCLRMGSIMDYILSARNGIAVEPLNPFRFEVAPMERSSRLVEFSNKSKKIKANR